MGKHLKSPPNGTPDEWLRGNNDAHSTRGGSKHDMASVIRGATRITKSPAGPAERLDKVEHGLRTNSQSEIGAGGGRLGDAARSIKSGAKAPCVDWSSVRKA